MARKTSQDVERAFVDPLQEKVNVKQNLPTEDPTTEPMHITRNKGPFPRERTPPTGTMPNVQIIE